MSAGLAEARQPCQPCVGPSLIFRTKNFVFLFFCCTSDLTYLLKGCFDDLIQIIIGYVGEKILEYVSCFCVNRDLRGLGFCALGHVRITDALEWDCLPSGRKI